MRRRQSASRLTDEQRRLVEDNLGIARLAANDLRVHCKINRLSMDAAVAEGYLALCSAARAFDPNRGVKFNTYSYVVARQRIRRACAQNNAIRPPRCVAESPGYRHVWSFSTDAPLELDGKNVDAADVLEDTNVNVERTVVDTEMIRWYGEGLNPQQRRTYDLLMSDVPQYHIAQAERVSHQAINFRLKGIRERIRKKLEDANE